MTPPPKCFCSYMEIKKGTLGTEPYDRGQALALYEAIPGLTLGTSWSSSEHPPPGVIPVSRARRYC